MKRLKTFLTAATLVVGTAGFYPSTPVMAEKVLQGEVCSEQEHKLISEIDWQKNLKKAEKLAAEQNKLVFWLHMVGKIDGAT